MIAVIDPAVATPELECFNQLVHLSPHKLTYHLPALFGLSSLEQIRASVSGILILGSRSSVWDKLPWQAQLTDWLWPFLKKGVPTLGLCFGHQFLAQLHGAKVEYLSVDKKKVQGFRQVKIEQSRLWGNCSGELFGSHCEVVTSVPKGFRKIASSEPSKIEGLEHESLPIYTLQSHPEAVPNFLQNNLDSNLFSFGHKLIEKYFLNLRA